MGEVAVSEFTGWATVEIMGHNKLAGYVGDPGWRWKHLPDVALHRRAGARANTTEGGDSTSRESGGNCRRAK
jgi:hypothetical protein